MKMADTLDGCSVPSWNGVPNIAPSHGAVDVKDVDRLFVQAEIVDPVTRYWVDWDAYRR